MAMFTKPAVRVHHISSHFTNGLWPAGVVLFFSYLLTGKSAYESAAYYCFILSTLGSPFVLFSGVIDWKLRFKGRTTRIFTHKRVFGFIFMLLSILMVAWRFFDPSAPTAESGYRIIYTVLLLLNCGFVIYLGYLGGKFL
jgi:uncharacterized membrane protein